MQCLSTELVKDNLKRISELIDKKSDLFEGDSMLAVARNENAEACLDQGLAHYEKGEWDKAKALFLEGLKIDPNHVDLLVHAGLVDFLHDSYPLALTYQRNSTSGPDRILTLSEMGMPYEFVL